MHRSHLPLKAWFVAVHIVTSHSTASRRCSCRPSSGCAATRPRGSSAQAAPGDGRPRARLLQDLVEVDETEIPRAARTIRPPPAGAAPWASCSSPVRWSSRPRASPAASASRRSPTSPPPRSRPSSPPSPPRRFGRGDLTQSCKGRAQQRLIRVRRTHGVDRVCELGHAGHEVQAPGRQIGLRRTHPAVSGPAGCKDVFDREWT